MVWNGAPNLSKDTPFDGSQMEYIGEAIQKLEEVVEKDEGDTIFLWTGGKEANVIADLLLYAVGKEGEMPLPVGIIDTGNAFDEIYEFREKYLEASGDRGADTVGPFSGIPDEKVYVEKFDRMLEEVINNKNDPRGYHGEHTGKWLCEECGEEAERSGKNIDCGECRHEEKLTGIRGSNLSPEEWNVANSCGALKVVPMKRMIEENGFTKMVTGVRSDDMIVQGQDGDTSGMEEQREEPASHTRINPLYNWEEANVWAYLKAESVSIPDLYRQGYRHTDAECCTEDAESQVSEYGEGGIDAEKEAAKDQLQEMGYI